MLRQQLGTPEALGAVRRMRPDLTQADDLTVVETLLQEMQQGPVARSLGTPEVQAAPAGPIQDRLVFDEAEPSVAQPQRGRRNLLDIWFPQLRVEDPKAALQPPPVVRPERPIPAPLPPREPLVPLPEWGSAAKHALPSETELAVEARELGGVRDTFQHQQGTSYTAGVRAAAEQDARRGLSVQAPPEGRSLEELYSLAQSRLAPDEFARMRLMHQELPESEIRYDLEFRVGSSKSVKGSPEPDIDALMDQEQEALIQRAQKGFDEWVGDEEFNPGSFVRDLGIELEGMEAQREAIQRLYYEGDPEAFPSAPGGRAGRRVVQTLEPLEDEQGFVHNVRVAKRLGPPVVSPIARKEPLEPGLADDVYEAERKEFLRDTRVTRDDLPLLQQREKDLLKELKKLAGTPTVYRKDASVLDAATRGQELQSPAAQKLLKELGAVRDGLKSVEEEVAGRGAHLDTLRESGFVSPRVTGEFVEGEHQGPQVGQRIFPFQKGSQVTFQGDLEDGDPLTKGGPPRVAFKAGNKILEGEIVHIVPSYRVKASKEEVRATAIEQGHLRNAGVPGKERQVKGPMPTFFNWPQVVEEQPSSGTGVTQAYVKRSGRGKPDETTVWNRRTMENPPTVRVRLKDGREVNVPGEALRPANRAGAIALEQRAQKLEEFANRPQQTLDFETGGNLNARVAEEAARTRTQAQRAAGTNPNYEVLDGKADAQGKILVRQKLKNGWAKPTRMPVQDAQKRGIIPEDTPVGVRTAASGPVEIPEVGTKAIPGGVQGKKFPGIIRPGDQVRYRGQVQEVEEVRPSKTGKTLDILFKGGGAAALAGGLASILGAEQPGSLEELEGLEASTAGFRLPRGIFGGGSPPPPPLDPKIRKVTPAPGATPNPESKLPWSTRANEMLFEDKAKVFAGAHWGDTYGNSQLVPGGTHDPSTNPAFLAQSLLEGGGHMPEAYIGDFRAVLAPVLDQNLGQLLRDVVNYHRMGIAWERVGEKVAEGKARYTKLLREGRDLDADRVLADIQDMETKIAKSEVVPEGYTPEEIQARLAELQAATPPEQWQVVQNGLQGLYGITRKLLDDAKAGGLLDDAAYNRYVGRGGYLPVHRLLNEYNPHSEEISTRPGAGATTPTTTTRMNLGDEVEISQELRGSSRLLEDPIRDITNVINGVTNEIARNRLAQETVKYYLKHATEPRMQDRFGDFYVMRVVPGPQSPPPPGKGYIQYLENGKTVTVETDQEFAAAAKIFRPQEAERAFGQGFKTARMWAQLTAATLNPAFAGAQVIKDPGSIILTGRLGKYEKQTRPIHAFRLFMTSFFGNYVKTVGKTAVRAVEGREAALDFERTADDLMAKMLPGWKDYIASPVHSRPLGTIVPPEQMAMGGLDAIKMEKGLGRKIPKAVMVATQYLNNALMAPAESASKYTGRQLLLERGYSPNEANYRGRKFVGTPDWNQKGRINTMETAVGRLPDWFMFIVPSLSGLQRFGQSLKEDPKTYAKAFMYGGAALASFYGYNSQFVGPDGVREMDKIPDSEWFENFIFILPKDQDPAELEEFNQYVVSTGAERNPYVKIPMPVELSNILRPIMLAMREVKDTQSGQDNYSAGQAAADAIGPLIPGGAGVDVNDPMSVVDSVVASLNPIPRGIYEKATGRQAFTRSPIVGSRVEANIPAYERTLRTHPTYAALGRKLGISPDQLQHTMGTLLGPYSEMLAGVAKPLVAEPQDDPLSPLRTGGDALAQTPVLGPTMRRFVGTGIADQQLMNARNQFYRIREQTEAAAATISSLSARDPEELMRMLSNQQDLVNLAALNTDMSSLSRTLSQIDAAREVTIRDMQMAPGEKQQQLQMLWNTERELFTEIGMVIKAWEANGLLKQ